MIQDIQTEFQTESIPLKFDENFFSDHAGRIITDPQIAIVELVANSWDAGSERVDICWPDGEDGHLEIIDDGEGMTEEEFKRRWTTFNYNRRQWQGAFVECTRDRKKRRVYGRNGKGRHSLFCFSDKYYVETWRNGIKSTFEINKQNQGEEPYQVKQIEAISFEGHGTKIGCNIQKNYISIEEVKKLLGSKFIVDPSFEIYVNRDRIELEDLLKYADHREYPLPEYDGMVYIHIIDSEKVGRLSTQHGVAFWVNRRLVGEHTWKNIDNILLDGRSQAAKRYSIIVEADILEEEVLADWTWFKSTQKTKQIISAINQFLLEIIQEIMKDVRSEAKKEVLKEHRGQLRTMGYFGREQVGKFIDQVQMMCPSMKQRHLTHIVGILANMELARSGYKLLQQLASTSSDDIDKLSEILDDWSITEAKIVLDELHRRLRLIERMEILVDDPTADELHQLQPLFEEGLWIFGPEYEGVKYLPNKQIRTILREFFGKDVVSYSQKRPDIVALPDGSIDTYSCDKYGSEGEVIGISKILIIELKRGDVPITIKERRQAEDYARSIRYSGKCDSRAKIYSYVLGTTLEDCDEHHDDTTNIHVTPLPYSTVLRRAKARTFNLIDQIRISKEFDDKDDPEISEVVSQTTFDPTDVWAEVPQNQE